MRKIVLMSSVSLDGFFEGPDRDISWHLVNEELSRYLNEEFTNPYSGGLEHLGDSRRRA